MPFTVQHLIEGRAAPVTARPEESASAALERMIEQDFSQLPVVDDNDTVLGVVTSDSLARAVNNLGVPLSALHVADALDRKPEVRAEDDLFDVLDDLSKAYAVLIVDGHRHLQGIVTSYDAMEYFRRRAQDTMLVEDIELMLRELIRAAFTDGDGIVQQSQLDEAIEMVTDPTRGLADRFETGLRQYLNLQNLDGKPVSLNREWVAQSFGRMVDRVPTKSFDQLALSEFIELIVNRSQWDRYSSLFNLDTAAVRQMLDRVRRTRNDLAHFRGQISAMQRDHLQYCARWLTYHLSPFEKRQLAQSSRVALPDEVVHVSHASSGAVADVADAGDLEQNGEVPEEAIEPRDSRYAPLALFLKGQIRDRERVTLTFSEIENIIKEPLPPTAREHRSFWANDSVGHVQSRQWLDVDWRVSSVDMSSEVIVFTRIKEREKLYIAFFSALLASVREHTPFPIRNVSPDGQSWITVAGIPTQGPQVATFAFSFARNQRFRIELYIDKSDKASNKRIFDYLYSKRHEIDDTLLPDRNDSLANPFSITMGWERLDDRRASRVALYCPASITDDKSDLDLVISWAAGTGLNFAELMNRLVAEAIREVRLSGLGNGSAE